jgi:hypothetical protein
MKTAYLIGALALLVVNAAAARDLYVSPHGDDAGSGAKRHPFRTLQRARDAIRSLSRQPGFSGAVVRVADGVYSLSSPFELTEPDSGAPGAAVVYRAEKPGAAHLTGGRTIAQWHPVTDPAVKARFAPEARDHILQADLKANGVTDYGELRSRGFSRPSEIAHMELFFKGKPMELARWPNAGEFARIAGFTTPDKDEWGAQLGDLKGGFTYDGDRPKRWDLDQDIWAHGYWSYDWANSYERVRHLDPDKRVVETAPPYGVFNFRPGQRFYFLNVMEELDRPGEYYADRKAGILYFWPPEPIRAGDAIVSVLNGPLVRMKNASYVTLQGFSLGETRGDGIEISGGSHDTVSGCEVRDIGDWGIVADGGTDHKIVDCDVSYTGDGAIRVTGGDRKTLSPANHQVLNNHLHHFGRWSRSYQAGVSANGVGIRIAHNLIHDAPHNAILYGGNDFDIAYNEIYGVCLETGDAGAIYTGRDYTFRGNVIRYNFIHHNGGVGMGTMAVYMDDCVSGHRIFGNVFWDVTRAAFLGGGRDHVVENNVFVNCRPAVAIDGRGMDKSPVWHDQVYKTMRQRAEEMNYLQPPYITRYPELASLEKYFADPKEGGIPPENNKILRNISVGGQWLDINWNAQPSMVEVKDNLTDQDPGFVDPKRGDFRLKADSPAFKLGFQPIPMEEIGPQKDGTRLSVPKRSLVWGTLSVEKAPSAKEGSVQPGVIRMELENLGQTTERGRVHLLLAPMRAGKVIGPDAHDYSLRPGRTATFRFTVRPEPGVHDLQAVEYREGESSARRVLDIPLR